MARTAFAAMAFGALGAANALEVITPSAGLEVFASRTYTIEWTPKVSGRFEIDLYMCGSMCMEDECGEWVTALCPYGDDGCPDSQGDYDIVMPEPMGSMPNEYKVRVMSVYDETEVDCSDAFTLLPSSASPSVGESGYSLTVTSPSTGDFAEAGGEYTVMFDYDNGLGSAVDRFSIDLYMADGGSGECGTYVTTICDKPDIGCKDSMGDYDVIIPMDTEPGMYSIRVGRFEDPMLYDCSEPFEITPYEDMSMSFRF